MASGKFLEAGREFGAAHRALQTQKFYARHGVDTGKLEEAEERFAVASAVLRTRGQQRRREEAERSARAEAFDRATQPPAETNVIGRAVRTVWRTLGFGS